LIVTLPCAGAPFCAMLKVSLSPSASVPASWPVIGALTAPTTLPPGATGASFATST
jgi:hypothetical protein